MRRSTATLGLALLLTCCGLAFQLASAGPTAVSAETLQAYEGQLLPLATDGGRTIEQGVKPAISDLRSRHVVPPRVIADEATTWIRDLTRIRKQVLSLHVGGRLSEVNDGFVHALDQYLVACRTFRQAALAQAPADRLSLLDRGIDQAVAADRLYDRAAAQLQGLRRGLRLPPDLSFPDPTTNEGHP